MIASPHNSFASLHFFRFFPDTQTANTAGVPAEVPIFPSIKGVLIIMSSSSEDLALKLEWYEIRDVLFGDNYKNQDVKRALELAATCRHPEWLTGVCA